MKYLSNRDEFLKRSIIKIDEHISIKDDSINEEIESGPFANDIPWNDSLLGRLINSAIRKAKIGANLVRIKQVGKRLQEAFDDLLSRSYASGLSKEDKARYNKVSLYAFLEELKNSVEELEGKSDDETLKEIEGLKNLTDTAIKEITDFENKTPADELTIDKSDLDKLIKELKKFREFLNEFKKGEEEKPVETEGEEKSEEKPEVSSETSELFYKTSVTLLKSVISLCDVVKDGKITYPKSTTQAKPNEKETTKVDTKEPVKAEVTTERFFYENESLPIFESELASNETKAINAWKKVESAYTKSGISNMVTRIQDLIKNSESGENAELYKKTISKIGYQVVMNEQTIGKNLLSHDDLVKEELNPDSDNDIPKAISLFGNVILAFKGDMGLSAQLTEANQPIKDFISSYDKLKELLPKLKSSQETKDSNTESEVKTEDDIELGKHYKYTNKKGETKDVIAVDKDKVVYPGDDKKYLTSDDKKGKELANKDVLSVATDKSIGTFAVRPNQLKKESKSIFRYFDFINEADEDVDSKEEKITTDKTEEVSEPTQMIMSQKIKDYWDKNVDIKSFVMTKSEMEKARIAFDKASKSDSIVIQGMDPIIEIVKVFNRAYKLHTTQVIPTGRKGGMVSNKTFREYTTFGGGSPDSAGSTGGPYRNNAIFDQWEDAVLNIKKDTKYQKIFRQETTLKTEEGNIIKDAGKNLLRFMNDMIDGDTLYKTDKSGKGKQAEFIEKYFGTSVDNEKLAIGGEKEMNENGKIADSIKVRNLNFTEKPLKFDNYEQLKGTFFATSTNDNKVLYFYIQDLQNGELYISYCRSMYFFDKYITESGNSIKLEGGNLPFGLNKNQKNKDGKEFIISAFRIKPESLIDKDGKFKLSGKYSIKAITKFDEGKNKAASSKLSEEAEIDIKSIFTLQEKLKDKEGKDIVRRFVLTNASNSITKNGGFVNIAASNDANKTSIVKK